MVFFSGESTVVESVGNVTIRGPSWTVLSVKQPHFILKH